MADRQELVVLTGFGHAIDDARLFAVQPDEWANETNHRTFVLRPAGPAVDLVEVLPRPVHESWLSANGTAYCPTSHGQMLIYRAGAWSAETVCSRDDEFGSLTGFSAATPDEDEILLAGSASIFIRRAGHWTEHGLPDAVGELYGVHGLTPTEVFICTDAGLFVWDGNTVEPKESPEDDELINLRVLSATELVAVGDQVHLWTDDDGWQQLTSPCDDLAGGLCQWNGDVFIPSLEGIVQLTRRKLKKVSAFGSNQLLVIGDRICAAGADGGAAWFDGVKWARVRLPKVAMSENP